jgi:hypothetical protein
MLERHRLSYQFRWAHATPFSHSATSRFALFRVILLLFKTNGDCTRMQRGEKSERQPTLGAGAASQHEAARERIGWLFCYWHT